MVCEPMQNAVCEILVRIVRSSPHISWGWDLVWRRGNNPHTITEFYLTTSPPTIMPSLPESHTVKQTQCGGILLITLHLIWGRGICFFPINFGGECKQCTQKDPGHLLTGGHPPGGQNYFGLWVAGGPADLTAPSCAGLSSPPILLTRTTLLRRR